MTYSEARRLAVNTMQLTLAVGERRHLSMPDGTSVWAAWSPARGEWILVDDPFSEVDR